MKPATACRQCRIAKRKCTREGSGPACTPCRERDLTCGSADSRRREPRHTRTPSRRGPSPSQNDPSTDIVLDRLSTVDISGLVEIYLTKVHGQAHGIFHCPTLRRQLSNKSVPRTLLYAMSAIGSKFSPSPEHREMGRKLALESKRLLLADMENICLENIQACILVAMLSAGNCHVSSEALFIRTAISMAHIMKLLGLWARMASLVQLSNPIMLLNRRIADMPVEPEELHAAVGRIQQQLQEWLGSLPVEIQMTVPNLNRHQQNGLGGLFVALHLTFYYYSTLLYFSFLEEKGNAPLSSVGSDGIQNAGRCKHHASSFSGILHLTRHLDGCQVSYPGFSHMITVSSAVLLHTLLLGDTGEIREARRNLNANFEALVELQQPWPATTARICLLSTESHKLDGWMVRFLLDHSVGLEDKFPVSGSGSGSSLQNIEDYGETFRTRELREAGRYTDFDVF
ncbi:hypothetical protein F5883DRAFT_495379 [Diaporthe sp. PMI_573]|nr:hypothetical protein F5883DRAFT_495379 [Diaporthaceae sp. PMI_573]